ncbi:MAG: DinB family protein [Chloroflexota bacterium]
MNIADITTLFHYSYWARDKVLATVATLDSTAFTEPHPISYGSIAGALTHTLNVEHLWRIRCQTHSSPASVLFPELVTQLDVLRDAWQQEEQQMLSYLSELTDEQLGASFHYRGLAGKPYQNRLWDILMQCVNHGTHHRSEVATVLSMLRKPVGDIDYIIYLSRRDK